MKYRELAERMMEHADEEVHMTATSFGRHLIVMFYAGEDSFTRAVSLENGKDGKTKMLK